MTENQPHRRARKAAAKGHANPAATVSPVPGNNLASYLAALPTLDRADLTQHWTQLTGQPAPRLGTMLLRHALAWELQAQVHGGLSRRSQRRLAKRVNDPGSQPSPAGLTLVREWKGVLHTVTIDSDEIVRWDGKEWTSLSAVARAITGTRWSGPAFFGLKQARRAA